MMAAEAPITPKKPEYTGESFEVDIAVIVCKSLLVESENY